MPTASPCPRWKSACGWNPKARKSSTPPKTCAPMPAAKSALHKALVENLPAIIRESVKPMEKIEGIKILHVEGLAGLSGQWWRRGSRGRRCSRWRRPATAISPNRSLARRCAIASQAPFVDTLAGRNRPVRRYDPPRPHAAGPVEDRLYRAFRPTAPIRQADQ